MRRYQIEIPTQATLQSDFVIGVLSGVLTLASLSLAIFGFVYSIFAQIMSQVGVQRPPDIAYDLKEVAKWTLTLTCFSSLIALMCIIWVYLKNDILLVFISGSLIILLIITCGVVFYIIKELMRLQ